MKNKISFILLLAVAFIALSFQGGKEPWSENQLMPPFELAKILSNKTTNKPIILNIGFGGGIPGSIDLGPAKETQGIENLKKELNKLPKNANIVIYCGCCPFMHCPNVRPAFKLLNEMRFINHKLLNLEHNMKVDWIDQGYPIEK